MSETLIQLRDEFATPCPTLSNVRERYFSHISSDRYLLRKINAGRIKLKVTRLGGSNKGQPVVYLHDLAAYLDAEAKSKAA
ncbi:pyocin activator PrtN family protein [Pseudomonas syringae]|uniref:Prophage PSPPH01 transcriptional regulator n=1 Tax=Pseudomonas syringae pv. aptata TaxID=83167 RepID=A0A3M5WNM5_PSEAP|nr:pyocin activator PrtN family protein [Pseudomonas syringae]RML55322.1 Prophage PSPPH01 transcriptional regulator [Pseudomonas syringae pv. pisi]RMM26376.1 Prophage PSPPH01 transcriptional regulator [Pseudomonas syringae pv. pisi]RMU72251.1 Prophage PSPPH01 transcriptional regulator [Pseudomonas syringae pv. aptata]